METLRLLLWRRSKLGILKMITAVMQCGQAHEDVQSEEAVYWEAVDAVFRRNPGENVGQLGRWAAKAPRRFQLLQNFAPLSKSSHRHNVETLAMC
jgi:hypothetical protein